jgi:hypothetical protein
MSQQFGQQQVNIQQLQQQQQQLQNMLRQQQQPGLMGQPQAQGQFQQQPPMQQQQQNQGGPPMQSLPIRAYLDQTVVPILLDGMYHRFASVFRCDWRVMFFHHPCC